MAKRVHAQTLIQEFESYSPKSLAVEGDKIGLQIGTLNKSVNKVMVTLDVNEQVVDEAISQEIDFIIAHHPLIFKPLKTIRTDVSYGRTVEKLIKHDISLYVAHTNLDVTDGGVNDLMADALGLTDTEVLAKTGEDQLYKLTIFVSKDDADRVRQAMGDAGAGHIGDYSHCSFQSPGTGSFIPGDGTDPYIGKQGEPEFVEELKIETIIPGSIQKKVIRAMLDAHPYEEPAYDVYPLANQGEVFGLGRIGYLKDGMTLDAFADHVKAAFEVPFVRVVGDGSREVKKVAVLGGDGNKYTMTALHKGADVYVTGDLYYHVAHDAMMEGLMMVDPGHNVEKIMKRATADRLREFLTSNGYESDIIVSDSHTDPFRFR
ncbi:Nif3-like dinuclear metal center hexameric protein [Salisediminibacterium selenitireducens]|uniref:GTP cyclohydrolase 1 type 2 homolog n=1 Tax=Bacillus selenitireducens (strain ATCC 700615 / DSM 15326 / MLS10) TaxID=439292 RepID=D6XW90_BACIE|nr:Nif3-like dinuclear metal center hexameric protein [Salisediminibacterium selenitireducens]ADH99844.1 protein of unknown function DUF34 [[Bacillus] selenitireducens MLS10]